MKTVLKMGLGATIIIVGAALPASAKSIDKDVAGFMAYVEHHDCKVDLTDLAVSDDIAKTIGVKPMPTLMQIRDYLQGHGAIEAEGKGGVIAAKTPACGGKVKAPVPTEEFKAAIAASGKCTFSKDQLRAVAQGAGMNMWVVSGAFSGLMKAKEIKLDEAGDQMSVLFGACK